MLAIARPVLYLIFSPFLADISYRLLTAISSLKTYSSLPPSLFFWRTFHPPSNQRTFHLTTPPTFHFSSIPLGDAHATSHRNDFTPQTPKWLIGKGHPRAKVGNGLRGGMGRLQRKWMSLVLGVCWQKCGLMGGRYLISVSCMRIAMAL